MGKSDGSDDLTRENLGLKDILQPVLEVLEDVEPSLEAPPAAETALDRLTRT